MYDMKMRHLAELGYLLVVFVAIVASGCMLVCYASIGGYLLRKMKDISNSNGNSTFAKSCENTIKTTKMLAIVTTVFLFSANVPYVTNSIIAKNMSNKEPHMTIMFVLSTGFVINNFFNPIIYLIMCSTFRQRSLIILRSCFLNRNIHVASSSVKRRKDES